MRRIRINMFDIGLSIFLFLSPIILLPAIGNIAALQFYQFGIISNNNAFLQLQFFQFGIVGLFILSFFQKRIRELNDSWMGLFMAGCLVSVFLHPKSVSVITNIFLGFLLYKLTFEYVKNVKLVLFPICVVSILNFIFEVLQLFGVYLVYNPTDRIDGLMAFSSHLGAYQAMVIPILYLFNPLLAIVPIIGFILAKSTHVYISVFLCGGYLIIKKIKNLGSVWLMFCMSLITLFIIKGGKRLLSEFFVRIWIQKETIKDLTYFGKGLGNFKKVCELPVNVNFHNAVYPNETFENPLSIYLGVIYALGILSIPVFIWIYGNIEQYKRVKKDNILKALFLSSMILIMIGFGQSCMDFPRLAGTIIIIFGLLKIKLLEAEYGANQICRGAS